MSLRWIPFTNYWICFSLYTLKCVQSVIQPRVQVHSSPAPFSPHTHNRRRSCSFKGTQYSKKQISAGRESFSEGYLTEFRAVSM